MMEECSIAVGNCPICKAIGVELLLSVWDKDGKYLGNVCEKCSATIILDAE